MNRFYRNFLYHCDRLEKAPSAVALEVGFSKSVITRWKHGGGISDDIIIKLADYFRITTDELLHGSPLLEESQSIEYEETSIVDKPAFEFQDILAEIMKLPYKDIKRLKMILDILCDEEHEIGG